MIVLACTLRSCWCCQYTLLLVASLLGLYAISRGVIIEPPAFVTNAISAMHASASRQRRAAALTGADAMIAGTLSRYFGMRFLVSGARRVRRHRSC